MKILTHEKESSFSQYGYPVRYTVEVEGHEWVASLGGPGVEFLKTGPSCDVGHLVGNKQSVERLIRKHWTENYDPNHEASVSPVSDLLTDLKTAYENLGYRVSYDLVHTERGDKFQCWNAWKDGVGKQIPDVVTPDLCKEMKDWMLKEGYNYVIASSHPGHEPPVFICQVVKLLAQAAYVFAPTEEEAILAAFLEVTKEKSE